VTAFRSKPTQCLLAAGVLATLLLLAPGALAGESFKISADGASVTIQGKAYIASPGVTFLRRGDALFVVSVEPGSSFLQLVEIEKGQRFSFPTNPYFEVMGNTLVPKSKTRGIKAPRHPVAERLAAAGQIYPHLDHFHLTRHYERPTWQALYEARNEDNEEYSPIRKRVAMSLIIRLLQEKIPGENFPKSRKWIDQMVDRAWRGFYDDLLGKQILQTLEYDFEILKDGRLLIHKGRAYKAGAGVSFVHCSVHGVHVIGDGKGAFEFPFDLIHDRDARLKSNLFVYVKKNRVYATKPNKRWVELVRHGQIRHRDGHYRITLSYKNPEMAAMLRAASEDSPYSRAVRERAGSHLLELLKITFEPWTARRLAGSLREIDEAIHLRFTDVQRMIAEEERAGKGR